MHTREVADGGVVTASGRDLSPVDEEIVRLRDAAAGHPFDVEFPELRATSGVRGRDVTSGEFERQYDVVLEEYEHQWLAVREEAFARYLTRAWKSDVYADGAIGDRWILNPHQDKLVLRGEFKERAA